MVVTAVCDEEVASIGSARIAERYRADAAIVAEPTELRLVLAHKGFVAFEIETRGRAAHGSRPDLGVDAIANMGPVLSRLAELDGRLRGSPTHPVLGSGSVHASVIEGGQEFSSYPERCLLKGERRTIPGESVAHVESELRALLGDVDGEIRVLVSREPFETSEGEEIVGLVRRLRRRAGDRRRPVLDRSGAVLGRGDPHRRLRAPRARAPTPSTSGSTSRASSAASRSTRESPATSVLKNPFRNEALSRRAALDGAMLRPRSRPYSRIRALPASLLRTRPGRPVDEALFRNEF